jgi:hypothetical protein
VARWCGGPGPPLLVPLRIYDCPENLRLGEPSEKYSAASAGRKTKREKKLSGRQKSVREIPSRKGEIIVIITVIKLGFIGIIITIITSTIITSLSRCNILG